MLAEERRDRILSILGEKGSVSVNELYRRLKVSRETIRRDITRLAAAHKLRKTHGGALSIDQVEPAFAERLAVNIDGKRAIGLKFTEVRPVRTAYVGVAHVEAEGFEHSRIGRG